MESWNKILASKLNGKDNFVKMYKENIDLWLLQFLELSWSKIFALLMAGERYVLYNGKNTPAISQPILKPRHIGW